MSTTQTPPTPAADAGALDEQLEAFADSLLGTALGAMELTVMSLCRTLGIYRALRGEAGLTAGEVAARTGIDERYARELLEHQAVAQVLTVDDPARPASDRRYALPEAHAIVLLDEEHPAYGGALADIPPIVARTLEPLTDALRTGAGMPFAAYGLHDMQAGFSRPMFANSLVDEWVPALPDVQARLAAGEALRVADVGCGEGWAGLYLAEAYQNVTVDGFDLDDSSIAAARRNAAERGLADRVTFAVRSITDPQLAAEYDLVFASEVIHDLADPVGMLTAMRHATRPDGAVLIVDEKAAEEFTPDGDPIERLLYAFSILHCLPVGRTSEPSAATGTVMRPRTFRDYALQAGFRDVEVLDVEHPMFRFYRPIA